MLFGALMHNWKAIGLAVIAATALEYGGVLVDQRDSARAQVTAMSEAAAALRVKDASMVSAVARQNAAIGALQDKMKLARRDSTRREARYAASATQAMSRELERANAVRIAAVPAGCQGAIDWGNAQGPEQGRW